MCINENCDHPEGMLDRDLRTTKSSLDERTTRITSVPDANKCSRLGSSKSVKRTRSCSTCSFRNLCHHLRKSFHKLKQAVTVLLCLSYAVGFPTTSSLPITRSPRGTMASSDQNPGLTELGVINRTVTQEAYRARKYYNKTFVDSDKVNVHKHEGIRFDFFFEHTLKHFNFPNVDTFDATLLKEGTTVNDFLKIFYDCFLRYNATMDVIGEENDVRVKLNVLLLEIEDYFAAVKIEPLKKKYDASDLILEKELMANNRPDRWLRNMIIYRDFAKTMEYVAKAYEYFYKLAENAEASQ